MELQSRAGQLTSMSASAFEGDLSALRSAAWVLTYHPDLPAGYLQARRAASADEPRNRPRED